MLKSPLEYFEAQVFDARPVAEATLSDTEQLFLNKYLGVETPEELRDLFKASSLLEDASGRTLPGSEPESVAWKNTTVREVPAPATAKLRGVVASSTSAPGPVALTARATSATGLAGEPGSDVSGPASAQAPTAPVLAEQAAAEPRQADFVSAEPSPQTSPPVAVRAAGPVISGQTSVTPEPSAAQAPVPVTAAVPAAAAAPAQAPLAVQAPAPADRTAVEPEVAPTSAPVMAESADAESAQAALPERIASGPSAEEALRNEPVLQLVGFSMGDQLYTVPTVMVQEVIRAQPIWRVPRCSPLVAGVINLRGKVMPLVRLREVLGSKACADDDANRFVIVCRARELLIGIQIDRVCSMYRVDRAQVEWNVEARIGRNGEAVAGLFELDEKLVPIISIERIVDAVLDM